jgi:predicted adenylyl cyclase CyaB
VANSGNKEIEIQVQIEKDKKLKAFLTKEAKFIGEEHQIDKYFTPIHRNFPKERPTKEWLRLRNSSGKFSINYKNWHYEKDGSSHFCDEYETRIEEIDQVDNIFKSLDIKPITVVDKLRKIYLYKKYEVAVDVVKGLGSFVEIEYKGHLGKKKPAEITKDMINFLKDLDCGKIYRNYVGYPFQLLFPKEVKVEEV